MGSTGFSFDMDAQTIQRSKEENQERAFVAASRRKDRSLDARLESANRASMLHKKRTGKALHITKEIVEREAMYEEVDERYQEKRMKLLKAHTTELEAQFHRHLMAAMAYGPNAAANANSNRASFGGGRVSQGGGIQKMRIDVPAAQSFFPERSQQQQQSLSPTTPSSIKQDPTSPTFGSSYPSPAESYVQTPGSYYMAPTQQCPPYLSQQQMSAFMPQHLNSSPPWDSTQQFLALQQSVNALETSPGQMASMTQMVPQPSQPIRQRVASVPDVLLFQQQYMTPSVPDVSRAQSEPFIPDNHEDQMMPVLTNNNNNNNNNNAGLSPPPMTSNSSQTSSEDKQSPVLGQDSFVHVNKEAVLGMTEVLDTNFDPEYTDFFDFSTALEDQWQMPMADPCYEDWGHLENVDYELAVSGI
ncbi:uncharacterized protein TRUGW13939_03346 [Talaromyces rugulosus]|uniref:Uncharacterized protein n=1 Tax=Talaromyces rugulosus TaxID=121627 RepID=A0A7H8QS19_TALRU|nr:uncharacterized protein TRUGW13939_03346 [Talaromyces rugulosus]QKX56245.1 hypothetical protein TRUGW13939_03346 [Talaromyces rugulosus]